MVSFKDYSQYYDALYRDKDYEAETKYILRVIERHQVGTARILELGCGTGHHGAKLASSGMTVHGVDLSESMLAQATARIASLGEQARRRVSLSQGDIREIRLGKRFDVVLALFHVISYMPDNRSLRAALATASQHLDSGGLFVFDFWYGPAVLSQRPEVRVKTLQSEGVTIRRTATPEMLHEQNIVRVHYRLDIGGSEGDSTQTFEETHTMRYFFLPELDEALCANQFRLESAYTYMTDNRLAADSWNALVVAVKENTVAGDEMQVKQKS